MKFRLSLAIALLVASTAGAFADDEPNAAGLWQYQDDDGHPLAWFLFSEKNNVYSARLVKGFKKPGDDKPPQLICTECPGKKKGAHIMGLTLFWGMKRDGLNYSDGSVLDPRDGSIYHAKMWFDEGSDGKVLHVRGYLGFSAFGQTQDWHRLPDDAMKTEDIPKEILANGEVVSGDKPEKHKAHSQSAEKGKAHKVKGEKPKAEEPQSADTETPAPEKTPQ